MTRMRAVFTGHHVDAAYMHHYFSSPWVLTFYIIGILAAAFHMANGLATMLMTWGVTSTKRSQNAMSIASWILMVVMGGWGIRIAFAF